MNKRVLINHARGSWYPEGQKRLVKSFENVTDLDIMTWKHEHEIYEDCPTHQEVPYAFKAYAFMHAIQAGYEQILWCDAAIQLVGDVNKIWKQLDDEGYMILLNGWNTGIWTSDAALEIFDLDREEAHKMPHVMANTMAFDITHRVPEKFVRHYYHYASRTNAFKGPWKNDHFQASSDPRCKGHRHDQSAASIIAWRLGMKHWLKDWLVYARTTKNSEIVFTTCPTRP